MNKTVLQEIGAERARQIGKEYDAEHDDQRPEQPLFVRALGQLADADILVAYGKSFLQDGAFRAARRHMVQAAALLVAEIERLDRATGRAS